MLGFILAITCVLAFFVGLEASSHGTLQSIVEATVLVTHAVNTHVDLRICAELHRLGQTAAGCPAA